MPTDPIVIRGLGFALGFAMLLAPGRAAESEDYQGPCALVASKDEKTVYVALADSRQIAWVDLSSGAVTRKVTVLAEPTGIARTPDGKRLLVTCAAPTSSVVVLDARSADALATIRAGHTAMGPAISPDGKRLYVCNRFDNDVSVIDLVKGEEVARVQAQREPVAAAVTPDGKTVLVANHLPKSRTDAFYMTDISAVLTVIDAASLEVTSIPLAHGSHSLRTLCVSPDGKYAYVPHILSNFELTPTQLDQGWANMNVLSVVDLEQRKVASTVGLDETYLGSGNPWGVACTADGKTVCVSHAGTHQMTCIEAPALTGELVHIFISWRVGAIPMDYYTRKGPLRRIPLPGKGPRDMIALGSSVCVVEYFSDTLALVDGGASDKDPVLRLSLGPEPRMPPLRQGELLFNDATICYQSWHSCASCHPDGRTDAVNWDLMNDGMGNFKNTKSLLLAHRTPPVMAEGIRASAEAAVRAGLEHILFTVRPDAEAAAIDEYLKSLQPVPSPHLVGGRMGPAAERGKTLFESDRIACHSCHPAPLYTDLGLHDVDTQEFRGGAQRFDTPTLIEVWRTAPYLHDGRFLTIEDLISKGLHGKSRGSLESLSAKEVADLAAFVLSL